MAEIGMVIMVEKDKRADIESVAKSLEAKGLHVQETIPRFRTIVGTSDSGLIGAFKSVAGVEAVRPQTTFQLPEMDEKVPQ
ncbi:hypothetical protein SAMN02799631_04300 [Methylobacterium sp. 174MFSha1.1]|uniref:hypothetical protein n=1 Tax=Methylobacterium sp. 174MFSha1.1 TaxID=1502749 RepID=UPI0008ED8EE4|nr:hypothetical protein [Methylobacterium sp. 174MFSha1.1]SFV05611.1 hypothetical protein SAMN02799631_04300 [Methylobacterium sp. 174MFSha1.1]